MQKTKENVDAIADALKGVTQKRQIEKQKKAKTIQMLDYNH